MQRMKRAIRAMVRPFGGRGAADTVLPDSHIARLEARLAVLADEVEALREVSAREQRNLGMVAAGLEAVRASIDDFDLAGPRFEAIERALRDLARMVDDLVAASDLAGLGSTPPPPPPRGGGEALLLSNQWLRGAVDIASTVATALRYACRMMASKRVGSASGSIIMA